MPPSSAVGEYAASGWILSLTALIAFTAGCGDESSPQPDAAVDSGTDVTEAPDATPDAAEPTTIEELPVSESVDLAGLGAEVDAVRDSRGLWHIYAASTEDGMRAMGYLQARDRMGQMEFIRRQATGRLAEFAGSLDPSLVETDTEARFVGYARVARAIEAETDAEDLTVFNAFAAGVTARIEELREGSASLPRSIRDVLPPEILVDWSVNDILSIARLQAAALSYEPDDIVTRTRALHDWQTNFPEGHADPRIARLAGAFHDIEMFRPTRRVYVRDGFPNVDTDTGTRAFLPPHTRPASAPQLELPSGRALGRAAAFLGSLERHFHRLFGDGTRGSNSWVVHGDHTQSGNPILANDPHLALTSPPLFWQAHLNTKRAGGNLNVAGQMIAGTPAFLLGFTDDIAFGLTTSGYDVTDVYRETVTYDASGTPVSVLLDGEQVAVEEITEVLRNDLGGTTELKFYRVPHHGMLIPTTLDPAHPDDALSIKWTGDSPTNEGLAFLELMTAQNAEHARDAYRKFEVGGQTLVTIDRTGDIFYTSSVRIPVRDPDALTYRTEDYSGASPCLVLDGTSGRSEWMGFLDERYIPHDLNPTKGYIATANGDAVGVTDDNDAHNNDFFLGCSFANGHRQGRIADVLDGLTARGDITPQHMSDLQSDAESPWGRALTPTIVSDLGRAREENESPGTHADLQVRVAANQSAMGRVAMVRDRLMDWSFDTPAAVEGAPGDGEISDSIATSIFNAILPHLLFATFDDELDWATSGAFDGDRRRNHRVARTLHWMIADPTLLSSYDASFDPDGDGNGDSLLWDDISTDEVESRADRILAATLAALDDLDAQFDGQEMQTWRWGRLHTIRLDAIVPASFVGDDVLSIPTPDDATFPDGFPRHGDRDVVDASNFSFFATQGLDYRSGPQQRLVVEMTDQGPRAWNALPGGNSEDPDSPHHRDEMEHWRQNQAPPVAFMEPDVLTSAEERIRLIP